MMYIEVFRILIEIVVRIPHLSEIAVSGPRLRRAVRQLSMPVELTSHRKHSTVRLEAAIDTCSGIMGLSK